MCLDNIEDLLLCSRLFVRDIVQYILRRLHIVGCHLRPITQSYEECCRREEKQETHATECPNIASMHHGKRSKWASLMEIFDWSRQSHRNKVKKNVATFPQQKIPWFVYKIHLFYLEVSRIYSHVYCHALISEPSLQRLDPPNPGFQSHASL